MPDRPNLLVIHTDQQNCWTLSAYGGTLVDTPNIGRLGQEGAIFRSFFTNSAVCTPSRGCLVTGRYPHAHGAYTNNIPLNRDEVTFAQVLLRDGYDTGYAGKWHLDGDRRPGWVHTRYQIVNAVHGEDYPVTDRSVDVQIAGLRKKLGKAAEYIETVRGVGYKLRD